MKSKLFIASLFGLSVLLPSASFADTVAGTPDASVHSDSSNVGAAIAVLPLLSEVPPNTHARYYIYLCSAGWCGPCNAEMPHVVEAYQQMKETGLVELVLLDFDRSADEAKAFMAKYGVDFPATMGGNGSRLPGFTAPRGIPSATIVDAEGHVVKRGHGSIVRGWKEHISAYEKERGLSPSFPGEGLTITLTPRLLLAEAEEVDDDAGEADSSGAASQADVVAQAMRKLKWFNGKPSKKAEYYIYLQSASWCAPCRAEMPGIAEEYKAMKKEGRVEIVLLGGDRSAGAAKTFLKDNKAKFPGILRNAKGVSELPGVNSLPSYFPAAVIVKADGTVVTSGHGSIVKDWRQYTIEASSSSAE